jgi:hypothetical protein
VAVEIRFHALLISALDGGEVSVSRSNLAEERAPFTHSIQYWVGPSPHLNEEKTLMSLSEIEPLSFSPQPSPTLTELPSNRTMQYTERF